MPSPLPLAVAAPAFRRALSQVASGVTVVTSRNVQGEPFGLTVTAFSALSLEPPLVLVCIDARSETHAGFAAGAFAVSVLAEDQEHVSRRFALSGPAKFAALEMTSGRSGLPLVPGAIAHIECRVTATLPGGDHVIYVGLVEDVSVRDGLPLVYHSRGYHRLEREPGP